MKISIIGTGYDPKAIHKAKSFYLKENQNITYVVGVEI